METSSRIALAISTIESAFADVRLGSGISVRQAHAIDMYESEEVQASEREQDEHYDWRKIPDESILDSPFAMTFMDPAGVLFFLPASMRFALRNYHRVSNCSVDSAMSIITDDAFIDYWLPRLRADQINAIVLFLRAYAEFEPNLREDLEDAQQKWLSKPRGEKEST